MGVGMCILGPLTKEMGLGEVIEQSDWICA